MMTPRHDSAARQTQHVIVELLRNIGSKREVEQYLRQFASVDTTQFAVIKIGGGIIENELDTLASALTFLQRVGLMPIIIHGAGSQLDAALAAEGIETERRDGLRVTSARVLEVARKTLQKVNHAIVDALEALGTRARPFITGVFEAVATDFDALGYVGEVTKVHLEAIDSAIRAGHMPILACLGETASGQILNINADVAARELALAVEPYKIVFLTPTGGLLDEHGRIMAAINLVEDYDDLARQPWVHSGMRLKLAEVKRLLDQLPLSSSVSITSPGHLAKELFTYQGSGTLIRKGEMVHCYGSFEELDLERLKGLLETCFQGSLDPDYFNSKQCDRVYFTDTYRGAAILTHEGRVPYLDKFAVTREAQGIGLGGTIWRRMRKENAMLFWRARANNPINSWYFQSAEGSYRAGDWVVFWYGIEDFTLVKACIDRALALPPTLRAHGSIEEGVVQA